MKCNWAFKISWDQKYLEIHLNDGMNVMIEIQHENFHQFLAEKMTEIMVFEYQLGTRTRVKNLSEVLKALEMAGTTTIKA